MRIEIDGVGIEVRVEDGVAFLQVESHEGGAALGVGGKPSDTSELERQRAARRAAVDAADELLGGTPEYGYQWRDWDGIDVYPDA